MLSDRLMIESKVDYSISKVWFYYLVLEVLQKVKECES